MLYIFTMVVFAIIAGVVGFVTFIRCDTARMNGDGTLHAAHRNLFTTIYAALTFFALATPYTIYCGVMQVNPGQGGILITFGTVHKTTVPPGLHYVSPLAEREYLSVRRRTVDFTNDASEGNLANPVNGPAVLVTTQDHNQLNMNVSIPYALNSKHLSALYAVVGTSNEIIETKLLETHARSTLIAVASRYSWKALLADNRQKVLADIHTGMQDAVKRDLIVYGVPENIANEAIIISPPQIRQIVPSEKVKDAIDEAAATSVLKDRQADLLDIERSKVQQRKAAGTAIKEMFSELPEGVTAQDIHAVLSAMALKENADALMKAVEKGNLGTIILNNGGGAVTPAMKVK